MPPRTGGGHVERACTSPTAVFHGTAAYVMPSNALHAAFRDASAEAEQLRLIAASPEMLEEEDDSWEGWLPLHNAARWGTLRSVAEAAVATCAAAAKTCS